MRLDVLEPLKIMISIGHRRNMILGVGYDQYAKEDFIARKEEKCVKG